MSRADELRLITRAKRGHTDAFRGLVDAFKDRLFAFVWRMVKSHHEAEDICQATFLKAYESLDSYNEAYAFSTWLFTIGYRLCLNTMRKKRAVSGEVDFSNVGSRAEDAAETLATSEEAGRLRTLIWNAVDQLSPPQKSAVLLFYREERSCQEIALVLGIPAVTVKSHLHRAREKLRELLGQELVQDWMAAWDLRDSHTA
ncbi:MAG: sigma-70 family RNA polymerase sigma factor [Planctomycetes bacterium]|nr:sigma-70 family RNA polymerase sigma factor [Planctomycetota bacterium]